MTVHGGVLTITQLSGNTYGGAIDLTGQLAGRGTPTFDGRLNASNVSVTEFLGGGLIGSAVSGPLSVTTDLRASGASMADMVD
ncbi:MAG: AsmA-like C-terminal region-containing protein, partial [Pseudomonadota bacterium]